MGVRSAAVAVRKDNTAQEQLVGYVVMEDNAGIEENLFRQELGKTLPAYMVPGTIMTLPEMPRMPSGKINRKALPTPRAFTEAPDSSAETLDMNAPVHDRVLAVLRKTFPGKTIEPEMDFFDDLGGHSLLAAGFVSQLRRDAGMPHASLKDVYIHRPLSKLITEWDKAPKEKKTAATIYQKPPMWRYLSCWTAQSIALLAIYGLFAFQIFIPYLGYYYVDQELDNVLYSILTSLVLFSLIPPIFTVLTWITKWLVIGKFKEGDYPLWG